MGRRGRGRSGGGRCVVVRCTGLTCVTQPCLYPFSCHIVVAAVAPEGEIGEGQPDAGILVRMQGLRMLRKVPIDVSE